ncbi:hypothetical protein HNQ50_001397 [Silvimonas terrae]|uniref:Uncharacterized protein n=1 Tax=Silvimonas terrae TaxID=300266 RepID=A0A840RBF1_9NEIS|nr:hypothetical protein [Silvimonas terrae]MBB5190675.1 hypothetical protein [Silvimonas terrae]
MSNVNQTNYANGEEISNPSVDGGLDPFLVLEHQASLHDAGIAAQYAVATGEPEPLPADPAAEFGIVLTMARAVLAPLYPSLSKVYTDDVIANLSRAAAPVMGKYGFTSNGFLEKFGPEITLAVVAVPVALETVKAIRHDTAERKAAQEREAANEEAAKAVANGEGA